MRWRSCRFVALAAVLLPGLLTGIGAGPAAADPTSSGVAVVGNDRAEWWLPPGLVVADYANNGYALTVYRDRARVEVRVRPLASTSPFLAPSAVPKDALGRLAHAVTADAGSHYQAVSRILGWMSRNVSYELDRSQAQDPQAVLARRTAYCTGFARLSVALLAAVGIEAREVAGLVIQEGDGVRFHRWIEVFYPDRGWVFSDPLRSHHYVPATYLPLASEEVRLPSSRDLPVRLLHHREDLWVVDALPGVAGGVRGRKNDDRQSVGVLRVEALGAGSATAVTAVLEGDGVRRSLPLSDGTGTFLDVEPGRYTLRLEGEGVEPQTLYVRLRDRGRRIVHLPPKRGRGR